MSAIPDFAEIPIQLGAGRLRFSAVDLCGITTHILAIGDISVPDICLRLGVWTQGMQWKMIAWSCATVEMLRRDSPSMSASQTIPSHSRSLIMQRRQSIAFELQPNGSHPGSDSLPGVLIKPTRQS